MYKNPLGKTGLEVTRIGLGAWPIGGIMYGDIDDTAGVEVVKRYLARGGNFIDTARAYRKSERLIARALSESGVPRDSVILATKTKAVEANAIKEDLETSLRELETNYVDLLYLHIPPETPSEIEKVLNILEDLKQEGKIRASGASIKGPDVTGATTDLCRKYIETGKVDAIQVIFSLFRQKNRGIMKMAADNGVGIVARTVLESGFLTGKYQPGAEFPQDDHRNRWSPEKRDRIFEKAQALKAMDYPPPYSHIVEIAARYVIDEGGVTSAILGATRPDQVDKNCDLDALPPLSFEFRNTLTRQCSDCLDLLNTG